MKKQIESLINSSDATLQISPVAYLDRRKGVFSGLEVDVLELRVYRINHVEYSKSCLIESRDFSGVVSEVDNKLHSLLVEIADEACKQFRNGYGISEVVPHA